MPRTSRTPTNHSRRLALPALAATSLLLGMALTLAPGQELVGDAVVALTDHTPGELVRHAQRRMEGHPRLQALGTPVLRALQRRIEREVPAPLPTLGKGQQPRALAAQRYAEAGAPLPLAAPAEAPAAGGGVLLRTEAEIAAAMQRARPGQRLVIAPGRYRITRPLHTGAAGTAQAPIVLQAAQPGQVTLEIDAVEGLVVSNPFWVIENLTLRGVCRYHDDCEHAVHVVGAARSTVLRNNLLEDFNAHVKVNGLGGRWPDDGLLQFNTVRNGAPRETHKPVTLVDVVAASGWRVADNVVADFAKARGNGISFGVFMKGAGHGGRMERNLVICTTHDISQPGARVGLSFGGGGTGHEFCRDGHCDSEHIDGTVAHNVVAHCNDTGVHVFRSTGITVAYNTLINTAGVEVRVVPAYATVEANVIEGYVRARDGGEVQVLNNVVGRMAGTLEQVDGLLLEAPAALAQLEQPPSGPLALDFCGRARTADGVPGAVVGRLPCAGAPAP